MAVNLITAVGAYVPGKGYPIGRKNTIPWKSKSDMKWFKETTMGHVVIMGKNTWKSLPKPLEGRTNIVVSWDEDNRDMISTDDYDVRLAYTVEEAIDMASKISEEDIFIIGGASIYKYAIENGLVENMYIDFLSEKVEDADAFFPNFNNNEWTITNVNEVEKRKAYGIVFSKCNGANNHVDEQYFNLVNEIIEKGEIKDTRAGKTHSLFSRQLRFNLKEGLPMLTTKKVYSKGIIHELLWFLKGDTNIKYLVDNNVHIWDDDAYRYYLEVVKKHNNIRPLGTCMEWESYKRPSITPVSKEEFMEKVKAGEKMWVIVNERAYIMSYTPNNWEYEYQYGDLNRVYGAQWTNWNGHNQIQEVIDTLKTNPDDRRMIISAWNVAEIPDMALPPCHFCCQFYTKKMTHDERMSWAYQNLGIDPLSFFVDFTDEDLDKHNVPTRKLSCCFHMRSNDLGSGTSFNWVSYALLTHMIAQCVNMDVDELIYEVGDAHIYDNHIEFLKEQLKRNPHMYALPKLELKPDIKDIFDFRYDDIKIVGYESYPAIKLPLNVGL